MTPVEAISLITALVSLGVAWRAYLLSKHATRLQSDAHALQSSDLGAKQEAKLQITNETFLSTWQRNPDPPRCDTKDLDIIYSSVLQNKGESVARLRYAVIELGVAESLLDAPRPGFSVAIAGPMYLAAGEAVALSATVSAEHLKLVRLFCQLPSGTVVCTLVIHFSGYTEERRIRRTEMYRMTESGGIVSKAGYEAASKVPRSYPVIATEDQPKSDA